MPVAQSAGPSRVATRRTSPILWGEYSKARSSWEASPSPGAWAEERRSARRKRPGPARSVVGASKKASTVAAVGCRRRCLGEKSLASFLFKESGFDEVGPAEAEANGASSSCASVARWSSSWWWSVPDAADVCGEAAVDGGTS